MHGATCDPDCGPADISTSTEQLQSDGQMISVSISDGREANVEGNIAAVTQLSAVVPPLRQIVNMLKMNSPLADYQ